MDTFTKRRRRELMQAVRREKTHPETVFGSLLDLAGIPFRENVRGLAGTPDIYIPNLELVIFVNGCFWHGHKRCTKGKSPPKSNRRYWQEKIERNTTRDRRVARQLRRMGYSVFVVWECELRRASMPARLVARLRRGLPKRKGSKLPSPISARLTACHT